MKSVQYFLPESNFCHAHTGYARMVPSTFPLPAIQHGVLLLEVGQEVFRDGRYAFTVRETEEPLIIGDVVRFMGRR